MFISSISLDPLYSCQPFLPQIPTICMTMSPQPQSFPALSLIFHQHAPSLGSFQFLSYPALWFHTTSSTISLLPHLILLLRFFTAVVSTPHIIAGLTTLLCTFPLNLTLTDQSHRTLDTFFLLVHPLCSV